MRVGKSLLSRSSGAPRANNGALLGRSCAAAFGGDASAATPAATPAAVKPAANPNPSHQHNKARPSVATPAAVPPAVASGGIAAMLASAAVPQMQQGSPPVLPVAPSLLALALKGRVTMAAKGKDHATALDCWREARIRGHDVTLDANSYVTIIGLCVTNASPGPDRRLSSVDSRALFGEAFKVFDSLVESGHAVPPEAFNLIAKAFGNVGNAKFGERVAKIMAKQGLEPSTVFTANLVMAHCKGGNLKLALPLYGAMKEAGTRGTASMYAAVATALAARGLSRRCAEVVGDMLEAGYQPSPFLVSQCLNASIARSDAPTLLMSCGWIGALGSMLDRGTCQALLDVAANRGSADLASASWNLMTSSFSYPPTYQAYAAMAHAFGSAGDDHAMLSCLAEVDAHVSLGPAAPELVSSCAYFLGQSQERCDEAYYLLQHMHAEHQAHKSATAAAAGAAASAGGEAAAEAEAAAATKAVGSRAVTVGALNAVVEACALQGSLERAFATFDDFGPGFGLAPNLTSYHALLKACGARSKPECGVAMALLEDLSSKASKNSMDEKAGSANKAAGTIPVDPRSSELGGGGRGNGGGIVPTAETYHLCVEALLRGGYVAEVEDLLERMGYKGLSPQTRTLHLLAHHRINTYDPAGAEALVHQLSAASSATSDGYKARVPGALLRRLMVALEGGGGYHGRGGSGRQQHGDDGRGQGGQVRK